ncbi:MAG: hypothetical protein IPO63_18270 [Bacteroidetes bacterium]|nr:hypothetical protein [Bacteroidota bacterium]
MKFVQSFLYSGTLINCRPPNLVILGAQPPLSSLPICNFFNSNGCDLFWNIEGVSFFDSDTNCILGTNDHVLKNLKLNLFKNGTLNQITFSDTIGYYNFDTFAFDFYKTELERSGLPFEVFCPSSGFYLDTISLVDSIKFNRDFSLKCKGIDLAATSISSFALIPASVRKIKIGAGDYSNSFGAHCATGVSGTVTITITGSCNYISPAAVPLHPILLLEMY